MSKIFEKLLDIILSFIPDVIISSIKKIFHIRDKQTLYQEIKEFRKVFCDLQREFLDYKIEHSYTAQKEMEYFKEKFDFCIKGSIHLFNKKLQGKLHKVNAIINNLIEQLSGMKDVEEQLNVAFNGGDSNTHFLKQAQDDIKKLNIDTDLSKELEKRFP